MNQDTYRFQTKAIHAGGEGKHPKNALNPPIFQTTTFEFDNLEHVEQVMAFQSDDYVYTRGNNPTLRLFEQRMAALEEGAGAVAFASGMAAISSTLLSLLQPGEHLVAHRTLYGSTYNVVTQLLPTYHITASLIDFTQEDLLLNAITPQTRVLYFETPANPNLTIIDIQRVVELARQYNSQVVVDNTFASPYFQRPLKLDVDVVVHSATKYIGGHGDVIAGVAISKNQEYLHRLRFDYMCELGGTLSPFNAWLLLRGLKTLGLRMAQHERNAKALAEFLVQHPRVNSVMYPGLKNFPGHSLAKRQMDGFGAMISFEPVGGLPAAARIIERLKLAKLAVSLGDCETLVECPAAMTHRGYAREELAQFGLTESMIRISVGLEDFHDILEDFDHALTE